MALSKVIGATLIGITAVPITIEIDAHNGLPGEIIVGLPDLVVKESRIRIRSAIKQAKFRYPLQAYTINLAPAELKKEGPLLDFPIAVGILQATGQIDDYPDTLFVGELALSGDVRPVHGIVSICDMAKEAGFSRVFIPKDNYHEATLITGLTIVPVDTLGDMLTIAQGNSLPIPDKKIVIDTETEPPDYSEIRGQHMAKRACEIAAAGRHNILFSGPPGSGKTMLAKRLPYLMPPLTHDESIDVYKISTVSRKKQVLSDSNRRPFRAPHHTISYAGLVGGGRSPLPGEISLAHNGILFLDELPEFPRLVLEALRQPMESHVISISRANFSVDYPAKFMLVAAMNPCPCGYYGDTTRKCSCSKHKRHAYYQKLSGPLLDRIDLLCSVPRPDYTAMVDQSDKGDVITTKVLKDKVDAAYDRQAKRNPDQCSNADLSPKAANNHCYLSEDSQSLVKQVMKKGLLTGRGYAKLIRVARTIADLDNSDYIAPQHVTEALQFRQSFG